MIPVAISLLGTKLRAGEYAVLGLVRATGHRFHPCTSLTVVAIEDLTGRGTIYAVVMVTIFFECVSSWFYGRALIRLVWQTYSENWIRKARPIQK